MLTSMLDHISSKVIGQIESRCTLDAKGFKNIKGQTLLANQYVLLYNVKYFYVLYKLICNVTKYIFYIK